MQGLALSKEILIALAGGAASALAALAFFTGWAGAVVLMYVAPLPLFLITLGLGSIPGTAAIVAGLAVALLGGGIKAALVFGVVHALPAWIASQQAIRHRTEPSGNATWYPLGTILCQLCVLGLGLLVLVAIGSLLAGIGMREGVSAQLDHVLRVMAPLVGESIRVDMVDKLTPVFPGAVATSWIAMTVGNGAAAQAILSRFQHNLRPPSPFADLELPEWASWLIVVPAGLALIGTGDLEYTARNLAFVAATPFFFLGLAVVHTIARRIKFRLLLIGFYLLLLISLFTVLIVAAVGVIEHWVGLRKRFNGGPVAHHRGPGQS